MLQKLLHFIKYHNAFTIGLMVVFIGVSASLAASPEIREAFVSSQETVRSIDNSAILAANLDNFDFGLQIKAVIEDERAYMVSYSYKTMAINDYVWQEVFKESSLNVSKLALAGNDLGLYVAEQLSQLINYQFSYLKEVQTIEKEKGITQKIATVEYAGLIGRFLSPKEITFPGYEPVIPLPEQEVADVGPLRAQEQTITEETTPAEQSVSQPVVIQQTIDLEAIRQIVREMLAQQPASAPDGASAGEQAPELLAPSEVEGPAEPSPEPQLPAVEQPPAEEIAPQPEPQPNCDNQHLDLCASQELCQGAGLYWYNDVCNLEPEPVPEPALAPEPAPAE